MAWPRTERLLVLLRGINVGGRNIIPMASLRELTVELGCAEIATYIQSGNLVCSAPHGLTANAIATALEARFGFAVPVILRTISELHAAIAANSFAGRNTGEPVSQNALHIVFLDTPLAPAILEKLDAKRAPGERIASIGRELFLHMPGGFGRSRLALACTAASMPGSPTVRNWKTVLQLAAMLKT